MLVFYRSEERRLRICRSALNGGLAVEDHACLMRGPKLVATILSYSSGNAGGIFAPSLYMARWPAAPWASWCVTSLPSHSDPARSRWSEGPLFAASSGRR